MRSFLRAFGLFASLVGTATIACGNAEDDSDSGTADATEAQIAGAFDVNDVSILFPLKRTGDGNVPFPQIRVSGVAPDGADQAPAAEQLWTKEVFDQVVAEAKRNGIKGNGGANDVLTLRGLWHIVGLRFDPCSPSFDDAALKLNPELGGKCAVQMRLIAQPFLPQAAGPADFTAHLVYNLGLVAKNDLPKDPTVQAAAKLLGAIKAASRAKTAGQPLGVHPGLDAEAKSGGNQLAGQIKTFIKTFAKTPNRGIAFMGLQNFGAEPWTFFVGRVNNNAFSPVQQAPGVGQRSQTLSFIASNGPVLPAGSGPASIAPLFTTADDKLTSAQRQIPFKIENTKIANIFNTDCVSCHASSARTNELSLGDKDEISARVPVPANITGYVTKAQAQDDVWNVRNFGYFGAKPTVSGRTLNETVDVVRWMNQNVVVPGSQINGPGKDCSKIDAQVWKCFRDGKTGCMDTCGAPPKAGVDPVPARQPVPITIDPQASADPCVNGDVGDKGTADPTHSDLARSLAVKLGGNDSACFTRVMNGAFFTQGAGIICVNPTACAISVVDQAPNGTVVMQGAEAQRFKQFFRAPDNTFFQNRGGPAGVQIGCAGDKCTITATAAKNQLPAVSGTRVNPD